jgi:hypothetical protein
MPFVVEKDRAEVLTVYPPRAYLAKPTAADVRVGTPSTILPDEGSETSITANIDATNTTLSAAAYRDDESVAVVSATGIVVGRRYLITSEGKKQQVTVRAIASTTIYLVEPLRDDVSSGATFVGLATTHTLTTAETSTVGEGHVIFRLTIGGIVRRIDDVIRVEPKIFPLTLTAERLMRRKEVRRMRDATDLTLEELIESGWTDILRPKLRARKISEDRIRTPSEIEVAHQEACILLLYRASDRSREDIEAQEKTFYYAVNDLFESRDLWYEGASDNGTGGRVDATDANISWLTR